MRKGIATPGTAKEREMGSKGMRSDLSASSLRDPISCSNFKRARILPRRNARITDLASRIAAFGVIDVGNSGVVEGTVPGSFSV